MFYCRQCLQVSEMSDSFVGLSPDLPRQLGWRGVLGKAPDRRRRPNQIADGVGLASSRARTYAL